MHGEGGGRGGGEEDQLEVSRVLAMGQEVVLVKANFCLYLPVGSGEGRGWRWVRSSLSSVSSPG